MLKKPVVTNVEPIIRCVGTTKTQVTTYEIYLDGIGNALPYRIGFVKMRKQSWQAMQWIHKYIGKFTSQKAAIKAVIETYTAFRKHCSPKQANAFDVRAVRLKQ